MHVDFCALARSPRYAQVVPESGRGKRQRRSVLTVQQLAGALRGGPSGSESGSDFGKEAAAAGAANESDTDTDMEAEVEDEREAKSEGGTDEEPGRPQVVAYRERKCVLPLLIVLVVEHAHEVLGNVCSFATCQLRQSILLATSVTHRV